jgi:TPR repeat protein
MMGVDVPQSYDQSIMWLERAANQGHAGAQCQLGHTHREGNGPINGTGRFNEAIRWYQLAADQGHADAQLHLGILHHAHLLDDQKARHWLALSAGQGNESARLVIMHLPAMITERDVSPGCANIECRKEQASLRCPRCKGVSYCDRKCQTDHWKHQGHKAACIPVE